MVSISVDLLYMTRAIVWADGTMMALYTGEFMALDDDFRVESYQLS